MKARRRSIHVVQRSNTETPAGRCRRGIPAWRTSNPDRNEEVQFPEIVKANAKCFTFCSAQHPLREYKQEQTRVLQTWPPMTRYSEVKQQHVLPKPPHCNFTPLGISNPLPGTTRRYQIRQTAPTIDIFTEDNANIQNEEFRQRTRPRQAHVADILFSLNRNRRLAEALSSNTCPLQPRNSRLNVNPVPHNHKGHTTIVSLSSASP